MEVELLSMGVLFALAFLVGLGGSLIVPGILRGALIAVAGVSTVGLGMTFYAVRTD
jgi:hypothetical protein